MSAVKSTDTAHEAIVELCVFRVAVLLALYRLMVGGTRGVCRYLPAVRAHFVMIFGTYFLLHKPETTHDITTHSSFKRCSYAALIVNGDKPFIIQIFASLPHCRVIIRRACKHLLKSVIATRIVCLV